MGNFDSAGSTLNFLTFLVASSIVALYLLVYGARCMLVVIEGTSAGWDRVKWPDEPVTDWLNKSLTLVGMAMLLLVPVGFLAAGLGNVWLPDQPIWRNFLVIGPALWLLFPIGAMSSLALDRSWSFFGRSRGAHAASPAVYPCVFMRAAPSCWPWRSCRGI